MNIDKIKKKFNAMLPYLVINIFLFGVPLVMKYFNIDGWFRFSLLTYFFILPLWIVINSIIYGKYNVFCILYTVFFCFLLIIVDALLMGWDIFVFFLIFYGMLVLIGNIIGYAFHKDNKHLKAWKIMLGILVVFLIWILSAYIFYLISK